MLKLFGMKNIFIFITSLFLICCQSQRYNIDKEKKIIIQTDIVTFYFPLNRVIQYTIKNNDEDIGELYDINKEYVFHADSPSYRINAATLDQYIKLNVALYGITKMLHEKEAIVIDNETSNGKWTEEEHKKFIEALYIYNCSWCDIRQYILTRSPDQIKSHAQKFYKRLKDFKDDSLGLDFTLDSIKNLKDIINIVKKKELESLSDTKDKLLFILSEKINFGKKCGKTNKKPKRENLIAKPGEDLNKTIDLLEDDNGNDYLWNDKNELELSLDTFSSGVDYKVNDFKYFRKLSL